MLSPLNYFYIVAVVVEVGGDQWKSKRCLTQNSTIPLKSEVTINTVLSAEEITTGLSRADRNVADDLSVSAPQEK